VYDLNFARKLCACIAIEDDPEKITDMWKLLVAIVQENDEEIWLRMTMLECKYALTFRKARPEWDID